MEETLILMTPSGPVNIAMQVVATVAAQLHPTLCNPMDCKKSQAPLSMGFPRQEYRSGLPFPFPEDLPDPGIKPTSPESPALQGDSSLLSHQGSPPKALKRKCKQYSEILFFFLASLSVQPGLLIPVSGNNHSKDSCLAMPQVIFLHQKGNLQQQRRQEIGNPVDALLFQKKGLLHSIKKNHY